MTQSTLKLTYPKQKSGFFFFLKPAVCNPGFPASVDTTSHSDAPTGNLRVFLVTLLLLKMSPSHLLHHDVMPSYLLNFSNAPLRSVSTVTLHAPTLSCLNCTIPSNLASSHLPLCPPRRSQNDLVKGKSPHVPPSPFILLGWTPISHRGLQGSALAGHRPLLQPHLNSPSTWFSGVQSHWPFLKGLKVSGALQLHNLHWCLNAPFPAPTYTSILERLHSWHLRLSLPSARAFRTSQAFPLEPLITCSWTFV